jgi:hypothetical protein
MFVGIMGGRELRILGGVDDMYDFKPTLKHTCYCLLD